MSMDMDNFDDGIPGESEDLQEGLGVGNGSTSIEDSGSMGQPLEGPGDEVQDAYVGTEVTYIEPGRLEGQHYNQIMAVCPSEEQVLAIAEDLRGQVGEFAASHGGRGMDVDEIRVEAWDDHPELGSYSDGVVTVANYTEQVNIASIAHEFIHSASFQTEFVEELEGGGYIQRDTCGLDTVTSVYSERGELLYQGRSGEMVSEGLTVSYSRSFLEEHGLEAARDTDEALSYELASDVADHLRSSFPRETDAAYFQGQLEGLRSAFDQASGKSGSFDEVSAQLDRASDGHLSLEERSNSYQRVQELMARACR